MGPLDTTATTCTNHPQQQTCTYYRIPSLSFFLSHTHTTYIQSSTHLVECSHNSSSFPAVYWFHCPQWVSKVPWFHGFGGVDAKFELRVHYMQYMAHLLRAFIASRRRSSFVLLDTFTHTHKLGKGNHKTILRLHTYHIRTVAHQIAWKGYRNKMSWTLCTKNKKRKVYSFFRTISSQSGLYHESHSHKNEQNPEHAWSFRTHSHVRVFHFRPIPFVDNPYLKHIHPREAVPMEAISVMGT